MTVLTLKHRVSMPPLRDPEVRLMLCVQRGDTAAFQDLMERYWGPVYQQLYLTVGSREEAEDLTQEVFLRVYRHRLSYRPQAKFATWLFQIVRNMGRNALRDRRRRPVSPIFSGASEDQNGTEFILADDRAEAPSQPIERHELREKVIAAMDRLLTRQREALEMQQYGDCSYDEIADELDLTPQAAKSLLYRARNQLREELAEYMRVE